jgi:hypothetical protein
MSVIGAERSKQANEEANHRRAAVRPRPPSRHLCCSRAEGRRLPPPFTRARRNRRKKRNYRRVWCIFSRIRLRPSKVDQPRMANTINRNESSFLRRVVLSRWRGLLRQLSGDANWRRLRQQTGLWPGAQLPKIHTSYTNLLADPRLYHYHNNRFRRAVCGIPASEAEDAIFRLCTGTSFGNFRLTRDLLTFGMWWSDLVNKTKRLRAGM